MDVSCQLKVDGSPSSGLYYGTGTPPLTDLSIVISEPVTIGAGGKRLQLTCYAFPNDRPDVFVSNYRLWAMPVSAINRQ